MDTQLQNLINRQHQRMREETAAIIHKARLAYTAMLDGLPGKSAARQSSLEAD
jgi:hypothetical protein